MGTQAASAVEGRPLGVEGPAGDQVLHRDRVVARPEPVLLVELVRLLDLDHVECDAQARRLRYLNEADYIKLQDGYTLNVRRINPDGTRFISPDRPADHPSETELDDYNFDFRIETKSDVLTAEFAVTLAGYLLALEVK